MDTSFRVYDHIIYHLLKKVFTTNSENGVISEIPHKQRYDFFTFLCVPVPQALRGAFTFQNGILS